MNEIAGRTQKQHLLLATRCRLRTIHVYIDIDAPLHLYLQMSTATTRRNPMITAGESHSKQRSHDMSLCVRDINTCTL